MYEVRKLAGDLELFINPEISTTDTHWIAHAYIDGCTISSQGGGLRPVDLKVLKLLTDTPGHILRTHDISAAVREVDDNEMRQELSGWDEQDLRGAIHRLRTIGLAKLKKPGSVISNVRSQGYIYKGTLEKCARDTLPNPPQRSPDKSSMQPQQGAKPIDRPASAAFGAFVGSHFALGISFLLVVALVGYVVLRKPSLNRDPNSLWLRQVIQSPEAGRKTVWGFGGPDGEKAIQWNDIFWIGEEGWLCGATVVGGGGGDVGTGILLHTIDHGVSWTRIGKEKFDSGSGHFPWGPGGHFVYNWEEVGPMYSLHAYPRPVGGEQSRVELWLAATTGMYYSGDDGQTWQRSTPRPDDPKYPEIYAHFGNFFNIVSRGEVYAVGWQGIAHWSSANRSWDLQLPTYSYSLSAVYAYPSDPLWDVWAVDSHGLIYHLNHSEKKWQKLTATGIHLEPQQGLLDILLTDAETGFAVGQNGTIVKGSKNKDDQWSWTALTTSPTKNDLYSIVFADGMLWIVGDKGIVLRSKDMGQSWNVEYLKDEFEQSQSLRRVRYFGNSLWIVGNGVVYKYISN